MKIAHILWSLLTGGTENLVVDIANEQCKTDDVAIFVINNKVMPYLKNKLDARCKLYLIGREPGSRNPLPLLKLNYLIWKYNPDIIHSHSAKAIYCIKCLTNTPRVRTIHGIGNPSDEYTRYKSLFSISDAVAAFTLGQGFISKTIYNGINTSNIATSCPRPWNDNLIHLVQVGRLLHEQKGQDIALRSISILKEKGITGFLMHFIGNGSSMTYLQQLTEELEIQDYVVFEKEWPQQKIYQNLAAFDALIQPSRTEGFGLTIAEGMAAKVPVIISNIPAQMEVTKNGELGYIFQSEDPNQLAVIIKNLLSATPDKQKTQKAYEFVKKNFDIKETAQKYLNEYKSLL